MAESLEAPQQWGHSLELLKSDLHLSLVTKWIYIHKKCGKKDCRVLK